MIKELEIPKALGFCKRCFRSRREGSAYCGRCRDESARMKIYQGESANFPLLKQVVKKFDLISLENIVFTYGDTIYAPRDLSSGLIAHEITHILQQLKFGRDKWWDKYLEDDKFRLDQELECYRRQYKFYKENDINNLEYYLQKMAKDLGGKMYGNIISFERAIISITS